MPDATVVEHQVGIRLPDLGAVVPGRWRYDPADPFAVALILTNPDGPVEWLFDRGLLVAGLSATVEDPAGLGDVTVWSQYIHVQPHVVVRMDSPDGRCRAAVARTSTSAFLDASLRRVRRGKESGLIDWDAVVAELLKPKPRSR